RMRPQPFRGPRPANIRSVKFRDCYARVTARMRVLGKLPDHSEQGQRLQSAMRCDDLEVAVAVRHLLIEPDRHRCH
ncbi:MAG: hypothetical protein QOF88_490, partial [Mycobacterium sp.]|nr:hypothetical protein [Mycobacterium sp.]